MKAAFALLTLVLLFQTVDVRCQTAVVLGEPRPWKREGGGAFTAALRGLEGGKVILQSADGRTAMLELATLSRNDRDYVRGKMGGLVQRWLASGDTPAKPAADHSGWPEVVHVPQESLKMTVKRRFVAGKGMKFASRHFEFESSVEIAPAEQRSIATPFELIHEVWRLAPWGVITLPKDRGLFQVELFLHAAAYEAAGGLPNFGATYDNKTKNLLVLGSAMGLDSKRNPMWRDEQSPVSGLGYGLVDLLLHRFLTMIPDWVTPSLALAMSDLPVCGDTAWPGELLVRLAESTASTRLTDAEVNLYLNPVNNPEKFPLDKARLRKLADYFMQGDGSQGGNLGAFLTAAAADLPAWDAFFERIVEIREAKEKHRADSSVVEPEMLPVPNNIDRPDQMRWYHVSKLLGTTDLESGVRKAITTLKAKP